MRFSIIIPAFNAEKYLNECLESVSSQTLSDFEVVAVDDGSSDHTAEILDKYAVLNPKTIVLHGPNQGPLLARRRGLLNAKGDYAVFLDADDCLKPSALETISECIDNTNVDIISFGYSRKKDLSTCDSSSLLEPGLYSDERYLLVKERICLGRSNNLCSKAIRLKCIDVNGDYDSFKGLMHGEDLFQLLPIIDCATSFYQLSEPLYFYRPNDTSSTAVFKSTQLRDIQIVISRLFDFAYSWGDSCCSNAQIGQIDQYLYLLKISELSVVPVREKKGNFAFIVDAMETNGFFNLKPPKSLRLDKKALLFACKFKNRRLANLLIHLVELLK